MNAVGYLIGAGSMSLGIRAAGFEVAEVWETPGYGKNAKTWDLNMPHLKHKIAETSVDGWLPLQFQPDLIYGNPPCGGLSNMTGCHVESTTNETMVKWIKMIIKSKPKLILMENAYQLATDTGKPIREVLQKILASAGYYTWTWLFYSWQIGCPQTRRRMFLCACSSDLSPNIKYIGLDDLPKDYGDMKVMNYIWDLENVQPSPSPVVTATGKTVTMHYWDDYAAKISEYISQYPDISISKRFITPREADKLRVGSTKDRDLLRQRMSEGLYWYDCPAVFQSMQLFRRPHPTPLEGPSHTILSDFRLVHPTKLRYMTMRECARLTGYSDEWQFHECKPYLLAQGVPAFNSCWAADRLLRTVGLR